MNNKDIESSSVHVVVLGIGLAGSACASALDSIAKTLPQLRVTLVDGRSASIAKYGGCRAAALGASFAYRVTVPNCNILTGSRGEVLHKTVYRVDSLDKKVHFEDGTALAFDYLICATGARNVSPCEPPLECKTLTQQVHFYDNISAMIRSANHVTVLGSGAVGTELAGEIKCHFPDKKVVILSPGKVLVDGCLYPPSKKFYARVEKAAVKMGIELQLEQRPVSIKLSDFNGESFLAGKRDILTDLGTAFSTDLILLCTGKRLNNEIYPVEWLAPNGLLPVKKTLQMVTRDDVFAIGDINDVAETKQGYFAQKQARVAAKNIECLIRGKPGRNLRQYRPSKSTQILVPLGRDSGVSYYNGLVMGSYITSKIKGKDLLVKEHWSLFKVRKLLLKENTKDWASKVEALLEKLKTGALTQSRRQSKRGSKINGGSVDAFSQMQKLVDQEGGSALLDASVDAFPASSISPKADKTASKTFESKKKRKSSKLDGMRKMLGSFVTLKKKDKDKDSV